MPFCEKEGLLIAYQTSRSACEWPVLTDIETVAQHQSCFYVLCLLNLESLNVKLLTQVCVCS